MSVDVSGDKKVQKRFLLTQPDVYTTKYMCSKVVAHNIRFSTFFAPKHFCTKILFAWIFIWCHTLLLVA